MYLMEQVEMLSVRLEDELVNGEGSKFPVASRLAALRNAELTLCMLLHNSLLAPLENIHTALAVTSGVAELSTITDMAVPGRKGIVAVQADGYMAEIVEIADIKRLENELYAGNAKHPRVYVFNNRIITNPATVALLNVWYIRMPMDNLAPEDADYIHTRLYSHTQFIGASGQGLNETTDDYYKDALILSDQTPVSYHKVTAYDSSTRTFTVTPAKQTNMFGMSVFHFISLPWTCLNLYGVSSEIPDMFHELMVTLAAAELFGSNKDYTSKKDALDSAYAQIAALNAQYQTKG